MEPYLGPDILRRRGSVVPYGVPDLQARGRGFELPAGLIWAQALCSQARHFANTCTLSTQSKWVPGRTGKASVCLNISSAPGPR